MRAPDVAKATAAGSWNFCSDTAAPIAMVAATTQEIMKTHMFFVLSDGNGAIMNSPTPISSDRRSVNRRNGRAVPEP